MPHLLLLYGPDGVGKSSFAAAMPSPLFVGPESGTANLDVARLSTKSFKETDEALKELGEVAHNYKTVVVDSLDWLEPMVWAHVCEQNGWANIETPGYGKGFVAANSEWLSLRERLRVLREVREMNVCLIAHSMVRTFQDPTNNVGYDRYQLKLNEKAASMWREFVDSVLFANFEVYVKATKEGQKGKAYGDGARVMFTERRPSFDAKNRFNLPFEMPLSFEEYERAITEKAGEKPEVLVESIEGLMKELDAPTQERVKKRLDEVRKDRARLIDLKNKVLTAVGQTA